MFCRAIHIKNYTCCEKLSGDVKYPRKLQFHAMREKKLNIFSGENGFLHKSFMKHY